MKIAMILNEYPSHIAVSDSSTYMRKLAEEIVLQGHEVHVITKSTNDSHVLRIQDGVFVHEIGYPLDWKALPRHLFNELYSHLIAMKLKFLTDTVGLDIVDTEVPGDHLTAYTWDHPTVVRVFASRQSAFEENRIRGFHPPTILEEYEHYILLAQEKWMGRYAQAIITTSEVMKRRMVLEWGVPDDKFRIIPFGVAEVKHSNACSESSVKDATRQLVHLYSDLLHDQLDDESSEKAQNGYQPLISIMVIAFNAMEYTRELIKSIEKNTHYPYIINILDNGSTDGTREWLQGVQENDRINIILSDFNHGCAGGRNVLLQQGKIGDFILFIDNDCILGPDWDLPIVQLYKKAPNLGIVGAQGYNVTVYPHDRTVEPVTQGVCDMVTGFFMFMRASVTRAVGGFDNEIAGFWHEDDDYCIRAKSKGFITVVVPVKVLHFEHKSSVSANIEQSILSDMAVRRRQYLCNKWISQEMVVKGKIKMMNQLQHLSIMIQILRESLNTEDLIMIRSVSDLLLQGNEPIPADLVGEIVDKLVAFMDEDFASYFFRSIRNFESYDGNLCNQIGEKLQGLVKVGKHPIP